MPSRRALFSQVRSASGVVLAAPLLAACGGGEEGVGAVEDLMREHGVLRRAILVFRESAARLRRGETVDAHALRQTADLFRAFGEDYHERRLEEAYIFPAIRKAGGPAAGYVDTLVAQHNRGREIMNYAMSVTSKGSIGLDGPKLADALDRFELMYEHHAAREDTIIFPAWKAALGEHDLDEMGEKFEDIEKQQFGGDGFDQAVKQIDEIEQALGLADLGRFTAPPLR
ncbi:MAG TPA: hemerythrin domain-containing protein [Rhizomicrobium sp.]|nr:hemerythrin domain-containing protein [Rhizomicrobium sp.]